MASSNEIRFKINPNHIKPEDIVYILERVAQIVIDTKRYYAQTSGYQWVLGTTNDWWMNFDATTNEFTLAYRYGHIRQPEMQALRTTLIWLLGFKMFNITD